MKITIEPTQPHHPTSYSKVELSKPMDDLPFDEALELVRLALIAWGYPPGLVDDVIPPM